MNWNRKNESAVSLDMKRFVFPMMTLLALGQIVYLFTAFDVGGAVGDVLGYIHDGMHARGR